MEIPAASRYKTNVNFQREIVPAGCQLLETATSVGRRFWGSSQASEALNYITLSAFGPRAQSA